MPPNCGFNMNEYLKFTAEKLKSGHYTSLHIVLGNESCDLDSAVCALVYAAFKHWRHQRMACSVCTSSHRLPEAADEIFVAVLDVAREDLNLKTEVAFALRERGIEPTHLHFRDTLDKVLSGGATSVTLVDHHSPRAALAPLVSIVTEVIDHRPIDKSSWSFSPDTRVTIETAGSCASLVARRVLEQSALFANRDEFLRCEPVCALLLHSTIILDTANFSTVLNKGTAQDKDSLLALEQALPPMDWEQERARVLSSLMCARACVGALSSAQLLRKDGKQLGDLLVPSLPVLVQEFLSRGDALQAVSEALQHGGCSAALLLGMRLAGALARDAALYCADEDRRNRLCAFLLSWKPSLDLSVEQLPDGSADTSLVYFTQRNLNASRKQYMPAITEFLKSETK